MLKRAAKVVSSADGGRADMGVEACRPWRKRGHQFGTACWCIEPKLSDDAKDGNSDYGGRKVVAEDAVVAEKKKRGGG